MNPLDSITDGLLRFLKPKKEKISMLIGIPKEIKNNENRVALTPAGVHSLVGRGHRVLVETNAGLGSGFADADYEKQGAEIVATAKKLGLQS